MATFVDNEVVRSIIHLLLEEDKAQQAWSCGNLFILNFPCNMIFIGEMNKQCHLFTVYIHLWEKEKWVGSDGKLDSE